MREECRRRTLVDFFVLLIIQLKLEPLLFLQFGICESSLPLLFRSRVSKEGKGRWCRREILVEERLVMCTY